MENFEIERHKIALANSIFNGNCKSITMHNNYKSRLNRPVRVIASIYYRCRINTIEELYLLNVLLEYLDLVFYYFNALVLPDHTFV